MDTILHDQSLSAQRTFIIDPHFEYMQACIAYGVRT